MYNLQFALVFILRVVSVLSFICISGYVLVRAFQRFPEPLTRYDQKTYLFVTFLAALAIIASSMVENPPDNLLLAILDGSGILFLLGMYLIFAFLILHGRSLFWKYVKRIKLYEDKREF